MSYWLSNARAAPNTEPGPPVAGWAVATPGAQARAVRGATLPRIRPRGSDRAIWPNPSVRGAPHASRLPAPMSAFGRLRRPEPPVVAACPATSRRRPTRTARKGTCRTRSAVTGGRCRLARCRPRRAGMDVPRAVRWPVRRAAGRCVGPSRARKAVMCSWAAVLIGRSPGLVSVFLDQGPWRPPTSI